jgi:hypothetical protein
MNLIESFLQLSPEDREKCVSLMNTVIFPIKFYLLAIVILLFTLVCLNIYSVSKLT